MSRRYVPQVMAVVRGAQSADANGSLRSFTSRVTGNSSVASAMRPKLTKGSCSAMTPVPPGDVHKITGTMRGSTAAAGKVAVTLLMLLLMIAPTPRLVVDVVTLAVAVMTLGTVVIVVIIVMIAAIVWTAPKTAPASAAAAAALQRRATPPRVALSSAASPGQIGTRAQGAVVVMRQRGAIMGLGE